MPRLTIYELPGKPGYSPVSQEIRTLRHWLTLDDGRIFYQDETLRWNGVDEWLGRRSEWQELVTPPGRATIVGMVDVGGEPMAMRSDGETFVIGRSISEADGRPCDVWLRAMSPVPLGDVE